MKQGTKWAKRATLLSIAFCACSTIAWDSSQTHNDNSVTSLNYSQESARTLIEIGVNSDPTFSVYSLKNPERVVVEILDCNSSARLAPIQVRNGIIDTATVSVSQSNQYSTCRVILGLEKEATYAVDSTKERITVAVDGKPILSQSELASSYEALKQSHQEALASAQSLVAREQANAQAAREEALTTRNEAQVAVARANEMAQQARTEAAMAIEHEKSVVAKAQADADEAIARAQNESEQVRSEAQVARDQAMAAALRAQEDTERARADAAQAREEARAALEREKAALAQLERAYAEARDNVSAIEAQRDEAQRTAAQSKSDMSAALENVQSELASAKANVVALEKARNQALERAQIAENQRDLAQSQARESLLKEQNAIASLQNEQRIAADKSAQIASMNDQMQQSEEEKMALLADLSEKTSLAQVLSERAERAQVEAQKLVEETQRNENARVKDAENRVAAAEIRVTNALEKAQNAEKLAQKHVDGSRQALEDSQEELTIAKAALEKMQNERDAAILRAQKAESKAQTALDTAVSQRSAAEEQFAQLRQQLDEAQKKLQTLEGERQSLMAERSVAQEIAQNNASLAQQNAELQKRLESQEAEMARLQDEIKEGSLARRKLKTLEAESAKIQTETEAQIAEREATIAELKAQTRQGRHAQEQLNVLKAENEQLRAQLTMQAATTATPEPVVADIATTAPIDESVSQIASNPQRAPIDEQAAAFASIRDIQFKKGVNGEGMQVVLKLSAPVDKVENIDAGAQKSVLRIAGAVLPDDFNKKYDTSAFNQGIKFVDSTQNEGAVELIAQASTKTIDSIEQNGNTITWNIRPFRENTFNASVDRRRNVMMTSSDPGLSSSSSYGAISNLRDTPFAKRKITLDIHDADINDLFRLLSDEVNTSIVVSPEVKGKITVSLKSVPLDQAFEIVMRMHDLGMRYEGNVIWIAKAETFRAEAERILKEAEARSNVEPLEVRLIPVNYATASDLTKNVQSLLSSRGSVNLDARTNTLIVKDVAANLDAAEILVNNLDTQTPQILIEARIVETQANFKKEIGIQWGGDGVASAATGNATGIVFPSTIGIAGGSTSDNNAGTSSTPNFAVNLPASVGTGSGAALGISLGSLGGAINLNIRLSSLEEKGYLKIVSAPRIMTLDNIQASIESGTSIPISVVSAAGAQTVFYDAKLNLQVTPHVTRDGNVYLKINISKNEPDFGNTGASGDPSIIRKEAHTELLIPDGETTVIGGIYSRNTAQNLSSVPFWGSIPILGYLFRSTSESDNRTELLIFITPRIINRDASIAASGHNSFIPPVERDSKN